MLTCITALLCLSQPQLAPVLLKGSEVLRGSLVLSADGAHLFECTGEVKRIFLLSGAERAGEYVSVILQKGDPPLVISRTMNQAHWFPADIAPDQILGGRGTGTIQLWADAAGPNRLLVLTRPSQSESLWAVTDVNFDARSAKPNLDWLLKTPRGSWPQAASYASKNEIEVWLTEPAGNHMVMARYVGSRQQPGRYLRRTSEQAFQFQSSILNSGGIVFNSFNPENGTLIVQGPNDLYELLDRRGRVLRTVTERGLDPNRSYGPQAVWDLTVRDGSVPGGKARWMPLAFSNNKRHWLLQDASTGDYKLLQITNP